MLAVERLNDIRSLIKRNNSVLVNELALKYDVTEETIRRDLKQLEAEGILTRVYGGAYSLEGVQNNVDTTLKQNIMNAEKNAIASHCLPYINDGESVFIDASTTSSAFAKLLTGKSITVVTNSLLISQDLSLNSKVSLYLIGGKYDPTTMSFYGSNSIRDIGNYYFDKIFFSCRSISMSNGLTDPVQEQALIRRTALSNCKQSFLLADHTKFDRSSFYRISDFKKIDNLVTDEPVDAKWSRFLSENNVKVIFD